MYLLQVSLRYLFQVSLYLFQVSPPDGNLLKLPLDLLIEKWPFVKR